jgi:hypothetical protein
MKKYLYLGGLAVLILAIAIVGAVVARGTSAVVPPSAAAASASDVPPAKTQAIAATLLKGGLQVTSISAVDAAVDLKVTMLSTETDYLKRGVQADIPYLAVAREGYTHISLEVLLPNGEKWSDEKAIWANVVPRADPAVAQKAVESWVSSVARKTGSKIDLVYDPDGYRADTVVSGSEEQVLGAVRALFNDGGYELNQAGQLEYVTVSASAGGQLVFAGLRDWVAMTRTICFQSEAFGLEY